MYSETFKICVAFLVGDRGSRQQSLDVELELRRKTNLINSQILAKRDALKMYYDAKHNASLVENPFIRQNWLQTSMMMWSSVVNNVGLTFNW